MKHLLVLFVLSVAFVSSASYAAPNRIIRGNEGAYGGDDVGLEFKALGEEAFREIWRQRTDLQALFDVEKAATVLENVLVLAVDDDLQLAVDGAIQQVVAVNYPDVNRILVSAPRWKKINDTRAKQALVLHEVLSIMGLETTGLY
ncbi:MAG: hypothetical protein J7501_18005, partial [Bdellovibrio sp.]|nr:hypothetical protein [Bdellovibrio sp.]